MEEEREGRKLLRAGSEPQIIGEGLEGRENVCKNLRGHVVAEMSRNSPFRGGQSDQKRGGIGAKFQFGGPPILNPLEGRNWGQQDSKQHSSNTQRRKIWGKFGPSLRKPF